MTPGSNVHEPALISASRYRRGHPWMVRFGLSALFILSLQFGVWYGTIRKAQVTPLPTKNIDVVMVYTGESGRIEEGMRLAALMKPSWFFVSRTNLQEMAYHRMAKELGPIRRVGDFAARTTDGNARAAAAFLKEKGARRAVLVTSWAHLPRATLLTNLYLSGSGIKVRPVPAIPPPRWFFLKGEFWWEYAKGWGSLYRVARHAIKAMRN
jgi:uncharacterized SAM-binding protein YcdF (DUF218 family)